MNSADAHARPSFWTYQRWQYLLGGQRGTVVRPIQPAGGYSDLDPSNAGDMFTVLQFAGTVGLPYMYVIFVDSAYAPQHGGLPFQPWREVIDTTVTVQPQTRLRYVALLPETTTHGATTWVVPSTFPADSATWAADTDTYWTGPETTLLLRISSPFTPYAWYSSKPLAFG